MFSFVTGTRFILASASPRRKELLAGVGLQFEIATSGCDEQVLPNELPQPMVERLALAKANAVTQLHPRAWVLGADTTVVIDGIILGKPENMADSMRMLSLLQGREHQVWGAFALVNCEKNRTIVQSYCSHVRMIAMDEDFISEYWKSGEPADKAGSYAIQGVGAALVDSVRGSYTNVVGLNLTQVIASLRSEKLIEVNAR